jgi:uncharacterized phage protein (TIGR01671 family)
MRQLKFRAFLKEYEEIVDIISIDFNEKYIVHKDMRIEYNPDIDPECVTDFDKCTIMQFTGLHDKNGKEICEGDIVARIGITQFGEIDTCFYEVKFSCYPSLEYPSEENLGWNINDISLMHYKSYIEVVGNIYEDPELLESKS